ncbi:unnamed protein product [Paramecium primaurelia]|uniref:Ferrochelatase n=1 Tax=Paramecium primaurelia TaxID=5886 RepID=A0A8S1K6R1_PARPR|nr:unnamed protein product [Paramecium primaurelia]
MKSIYQFTKFRSATYNQSLQYLEQTQFDPNNTTAILMLNLGGPNSYQEISPFLIRFFEDTTVIRIPFGLGPYIARLRGPAKINKQYEKIGGFSPLFKWTMVQGFLMNKPKGSGFLPAFRYGLPLQEDAIEYAFEKTEGRIQKFLLFSQYPQYSCSTGGNAIRNAIELLQQYKTIQPKLEVSVIDQWHKNKFYITAMATLLNNKIKSQNLDPKDTIILFTAHSLPADFVWDGEKYPYYIYESCQLVIDNLKNMGISVHFDLSYQSKVGLNKWLRPATHHALSQYIKNSKFKNILISPMGFTSDHLETLYELDIQLMDDLKKDIESNKKNVIRCDSLNDHPQFIAALSDLVTQGLANKKCSSKRERCIDCKFEQCDIVNKHDL